MSDHPNWPHDWTVLLIGGGSGVGKTVAAARIARELGIPHLQGDDFRLALNRATTLAEHPALHFFTEGRDVWRLPPERLAQGLADVARVMSDALEAVIAHHLDVRAPIVLEGDGLLPSLAVRSSFQRILAEGRVRGGVVHEPDEATLHTALLARGRGFEQGTSDEQRAWVRMSWLYGNWLRDEAEGTGLPIVAARPYETLPDRILAAVSSRA